MRSHRSRRARRVAAERLERRLLFHAVVVQAAGDSDDQVVEAVPTGNGVTAGVIADAQDVDLYALTLDGARVVKFDVDSLGAWDSYLRLFDGAGNEIASNDDGAGPVPEPRAEDAFIQHVFTFPGTYYIGVSSDGNRAYDPASGADSGGESAGGYQLIIQGLPNPLDTDDKLVNAHVVGNGTVAGRIETPNDADLYRVSVRAGDVVTVDVDVERLSGELDSYLRAFSATGVQIAANDDAVGPAPEPTSHESFFTLTFAAGGDYYFGVGSAGNDDYNAITGTDGDVHVGGSVGAYTLTITGVSAPPAPPRVTQVYLNALTWGPSFKEYLAARGTGDALLGYAVPAADQSNELPWVGMTQVSVTFSDHVTVAQDDLAVRGVNVPTYPVIDLDYDAASHTATWLLGRAISNDRLMIDVNADAGGVNSGGVALDGDWANGADTFPSGDGNPGGDFRFQLNVLPGDTNRSGIVLADDFSEVKKKFFASTSSPGTGDAAYSVFHDIDGSGVILANDFSEVKKRFFSQLPATLPASVGVASGVFGTTRVRDRTLRGLLA